MQNDKVIRFWHLFKQRFLLLFLQLCGKLLPTHLLVLSRELNSLVEGTQAYPRPVSYYIILLLARRRSQLMVSLGKTIPSRALVLPVLFCSLTFKKQQLNKEHPYFVSCFWRMKSIKAWQASWQVHETVIQVKATARKQRQMNVGIQFAFSFLHLY